MWMGMRDDDSIVYNYVACMKQSNPPVKSTLDHRGLVLNACLRLYVRRKFRWSLFGQEFMTKRTRAFPSSNHLTSSTQPLALGFLRDTNMSYQRNNMCCPLPISEAVHMIL